jgi:hypothetical protein
MMSQSPANLLALPTLRKGPYTLLVHGSPRTLLLRVAYALAHANDPNFYWVDVQDSNEAVEPPGPVELGWIPADHLFIVSRAEARPQDAVSNLALWTVIRSDEPRSVLGGLTDFLRLPAPIQEVLSAYGRDDSRPIFMIANGDRVRPYYPSTAEGVHTFVDSMVRAGVIPMFAVLSPSRAGRFAFDMVLEVQAPDLAHWREGTLVCEQSYPGASFQRGLAVRLDSIPALAGILEGHREPSSQGH